jgi:hypothetical protein
MENNKEWLENYMIEEADKDIESSWDKPNGQLIREQAMNILEMIPVIFPV